jgi:TatD DNase family protein
MEFVDAHLHLSDEEYSLCTDELIADARKASVVALVSSSMDLKTSKESLRLAEQNPRLVYAALGVHPWAVQTGTEDEVQETIKFISQVRQNKAVVAIGEIGLDNKYKEIWDKQLKVFGKMLHLAERADLPIIVHSRGTTPQIVEILPSYKLRKVLLHWFSYPIAALPKIIENGYYVSEGPTAIYSGGIRDIVRKTPLTNLLTETDGPVHYYKPPFDGKMTMPAFIPIVAQAFAEIKKMPVANVAEQVARNFEDFFGVKLN